MKKLSVILVFLLFQLSVAQKITKKFLIGEWTSDNTRLIFYFDEKMKFNILEYSTSTKLELKVIAYQFDKNDFYLESFYEPNNWKSIAKFVYKDEDTLIADVVSDAPDIVTYKRVKK